MLSTIQRLPTGPGPFEVGRRERRRGFDGNGNGHRVSSGESVPLSVYDDERQLVLEFDLPGVSRADLEVTFEKGRLQIRGRRNRPQREAACCYDERHYGEFRRIVVLDETIDPDSIDATLDGGVLSVQLTRKPQAQPQRVEVKYRNSAE